MSTLRPTVKFDIDRTLKELKYMLDDSGNERYRNFGTGAKTLGEVTLSYKNGQYSLKYEAADTSFRVCVEATDWDTVVENFKKNF